MFGKVFSKLLIVVAGVLIISTPVYAGITYDVPSNSDFKSYMDYTTITSKSSNQYKLQQLSVTNDDGLRTYDNRYCIALGNGFHVSVGDYVDVLIGDKVIECVVGDIKQDIHTGDDNMQVVHNGNVVEFIVDKTVLDPDVAYSGNISNISGFEGNVDYITVHDKDRISLPELTVTSRYSVSLEEIPTYIVEYIYGNVTRTAVVTKDVYDKCVPFESLYTFE